MLEQDVKPHYFQGKNVMDSLNQQGRTVTKVRLAGIFDCEGSVYLNAHPQKDRHGKIRMSYALVAKISNSDDRIVKEFTDGLDECGFGYNVTEDVPTGLGDLTNEVRLHGMKRSIPFLTAVKPYLSAKSRVLDLGFKFAERRQSVKRGSPYTEVDFRIQRAIRALNSEGTKRDIPTGDHLELVGPQRVAQMTNDERAIKLATIVECDGSIGLTNQNQHGIYVPSVYMCNTSEALLSEIRESLASLGLAYYFRMKPPSGISTKPLGEFHLQGMKRCARFMQLTHGLWGAYAKRAELIEEFIGRRLAVHQNTPYGIREREIKRLIEDDDLSKQFPSTTERRTAKRQKIQSGLRGDA